jgi:uncharacterized protein involved in exopolysaccharide biosynthesis
VLYDLQFFEQELTGLPGESLLSLGEELALTNLRQRSITNGITNDIIQIDSATFSKSTVSQALKATSQIHAGFQNQLTRLQSNQIRLEKEIPQMEKDLEIAKALLVQFTQDRDQSYRIYSDMLIQQQEVNTLIGITQDLATVSFLAKTPTIAVSPKTLINTALAGLLGFILAASWIFIRDWMNNGAYQPA